MKSGTILSVALGLVALLFGGCAGTTVKQSSRSSSYQGGPVQKVAVLVNTDRDFYRQAIENYFASILAEEGQSAFTTHNLLSLSAVRADRQAAVARLRAGGADSVMVVRLVDSASYSQQARGNSPTFTSSAGEAYSYLGLSSDVTWNSLQTDVYIETSLYQLSSSERIWSGVTRTVLRENTDSIEKIEPLARKLFAQMRQDGVIH